MPKKQETGAACGQSHPKSVLIVDDQQATRALLRAAFECLPVTHHVREAADGEAALRLAREERPDLVLLDVVLPGSSTSGVLVCNQLCRDGTKVVIVSGQASQAVIQACLSSGAVDYVPKPFSVEALREKVQKWLPD
jgi:two-component system OmpR family response regulator